MTGARAGGRLSRLIGALVDVAARLSTHPGRAGALARELTAPAGAGARWLSPGPGRWSGREQAAVGYDRLVAAAQRFGGRRVLTVNAVAVGPGRLSLNLSGPPEICRAVSGLALGAPGRGPVPIPTAAVASGGTVSLVASMPDVPRRAWRVKVLGPTGVVPVVVPDRRRVDRRAPSAAEGPPALRTGLDRRHRLVIQVTGPSRPAGRTAAPPPTPGETAPAR